MAFSGRLTIIARGENTPAGLYSNNVRALVEHDAAYSDTGAKTYYAAVSIAGSSTESLDLTTATDAFGAALGASKVYTVLLETPTTNGGNVGVSPSAANGWTGWLADASDKLKIGAGSRALFDSAAGVAVSSSSRSLDFVNATGSAQVINVLIICS